jgi:hypothetical protein
LSMELSEAKRASRATSSAGSSDSSSCFIFNFFIQSKAESFQKTEEEFHPQLTS